MDALNGKKEQPTSKSTTKFVSVLLFLFKEVGSEYIGLQKVRIVSRSVFVG